MGFQLGSRRFGTTRVDGKLFIKLVSKACSSGLGRAGRGAHAGCSTQPSQLPEDLAFGPGLPTALCAVPWRRCPYFLGVIVMYLEFRPGDRSRRSKALQEASAWPPAPSFVPSLSVSVTCLDSFSHTVLLRVCRRRTCAHIQFSCASANGGRSRTP